MSTKPTATRAYIKPTRRPLLMRSIKNSIIPLTFNPLSPWERVRVRGLFPGCPVLYRHQCLANTTNSQFSLDGRLPSILIRDHRSHRHLRGVPIQGCNDGVVFLGHDAAAPLTGTGYFLIISIQFFVSQAVAS